MRPYLDRVWQDGGTIVAVKLREPFLRYFQTADELAKRLAKKRVSKAGATGLRPANDTASRFAPDSLRSSEARLCVVAGEPEDHA